VIAVRTRPVVVALVFAVAACAACAAPPDPLPGYVPASAVERASVVAVIYDYFAMRERAAVSGNAAEIFAAHPTLALHEDRRVGVNTETFFVERVRSAKTLPKEIAPPVIERMSHELESYTPIAVYVGADKAIAFVHGLERFDYQNSGGPSLGEIFVRFDLRRSGDSWGILRTDEWVMGEPPPRTPDPTKFAAGG
jgi:hypothetical protein